MKPQKKSKTVVGRTLAKKPRKKSKSKVGRFIGRRKWCLTCSFLCCVLAAAAVMAAIMFTSDPTSQMGGLGRRIWGNRFDAEWKDRADVAESAPPGGPSLPPTASLSPTGSVPPSSSPGPTGMPSEEPEPPAVDVTVTVIVQLDSDAGSTGLYLSSLDNSTIYLWREPGSLLGMEDEMLLETVSVPNRTDVVFAFDHIEDTPSVAGDGQDTSSPNENRYQVFAGRNKLLSGHKPARYSFTVGDASSVEELLEIDPNEYCACSSPDSPVPCLERCAWCAAPGGFLPDAPFGYRCVAPVPAAGIPKRCFTGGEEQVKLVNDYVRVWSRCPDGFEAGPVLEEMPGTTLCTDQLDVTCGRSYSTELDCAEEIANGTLVVETCQDAVGGRPFGYDFERFAPTRSECDDGDYFPINLADRCCADSLSFCSVGEPTGSPSGSPTGMPATEAPTGPPVSPSPTVPAATIPPTRSTSPTASQLPTVETYPVTVAVQLDQWPDETSIVFTSKEGGLKLAEVKFEEGMSDDFFTRTFRLPAGTDVVMTVYDRGGDGMCELFFISSARCFDLWRAIFELTSSSVIIQAAPTGTGTSRSSPVRARTTSPSSSPPCLATPSRARPRRPSPSVPYPSRSRASAPSPPPPRPPSWTTARSN